MSIRIAIADDHELFASGLEKLILSNPTYHTVGRFKDGVEVIDFLEKGGQADLLILDPQYAQNGRAQLLAHLHRNHSSMKVLVVSMHQSQTSADLVRKFGAKGYIGKDSSVSELLAAIEHVLNGNEHFNSSVGEEAQDQSEDRFGGVFGAYGLSKREVEIIHLIINQYEGGEIARMLSLSPLTVKTHRKNIFKKLGVRNLAGIVSLVQNNGLRKENLN